MERSELHGLVRTFRDDGSLLEEITYEQGVRHGPYWDCWSSGRLSCEGRYVHGVQEGEWRFYGPDGSLREVIRFAGGREVGD
jgi:antitoxin component YwqK of YwqJK toxin-antitoxin module